MRSRDQERARLALEHVSIIKEWSDKQRKSYGSLCHRLPAMLQANGLLQVLAFMDVRRKKNEYETLFGQLAS